MLSEGAMDGEDEEGGGREGGDHGWRRRGGDQRLEAGSLAV